MDDAPAWVKFVGGALGLASAVLLTWWTILAFVGGRLWPTGIEVDGGIGFGLLWLFIIDPLAMTVLYWISMAVMLPLLGVSYVASRKRPAASPGTRQPDADRPRGSRQVPDGARPLDERGREGLWTRLRLNPEADPPDTRTLARISDLHSELAMNLLEPAPLLVEIERRNEIAIELYEIGCRVHAPWVNGEIEAARDEMQGSRYQQESPIGRPRTQEEFDEWQRRQVADRGGS